MVVTEIGFTRLYGAGNDGSRCGPYMKRATPIGAIPGHSLCGRLVLLPDHLTDALVIKEDRYAPWTDEDGYPVTDHKCIGKVDLKAVAADQFDGEWTESPSCPQRLQGIIKIFSDHCGTIPFKQTLRPGA